MSVKTPSAAVLTGMLTATAMAICSHSCTEKIGFLFFDSWVFSSVCIKFLNDIHDGAAGTVGTSSSAEESGDGA